MAALSAAVGVVLLLCSLASPTAAEHRLIDSKLWQLKLWQFEMPQFQLPQNYSRKNLKFNSTITWLFGDVYVLDKDVLLIAGVLPVYLAIINK